MSQSLYGRLGSHATCKKKHGSQNYFDIERLSLVQYQNHYKIKRLFGTVQEFKGQLVTSNPGLQVKNCFRRQLSARLKL